MNRKGFTLIELLSVIVLLALIGLLVTTSVVKIVNNAKKDMSNTQLESIEKAIKIVASENINKLPSSGECSYTKLSMLKNSGVIDSDILDLNTNEELSDDLIIKISSEEGVYGQDILKYEVDVEESEISDCKLWTLKPTCVRATTLHEETCTQTDTTDYCSGAGYTTDNLGTTITYGSLGTTGILNSGDAFDCDVNGDGIHNPETERFYYVTDLESNSNYAVLIYYDNIIKKDTTLIGVTTSTVLYNSEGINYYGPEAAVEFLPTINKWGNVSLSNTTRQITNELGGTKASIRQIVEFDYTGYVARFPTVQEINKACGIIIGTSTAGELDKCNYLLENTLYSTPSVSSAAYWLENPYSASTSDAWYINSTSRNAGRFMISTGLFGVRPVIEVDKLHIEY